MAEAGMQPGHDDIVVADAGFSPDDHRWMQHALTLAADGARRGEVPVGAIVVRDGEILGEGHNCPIGTHDPTAHAEIAAIRAACAKAGNYRLPGATLYVTLEPCAMCAGALIHARIARVVYAASEPRAGAVVSTQQVFAMPHFNHSVRADGGLCAEESAQLLREFFAARRRAGKPS